MTNTHKTMQTNDRLPYLGTCIKEALRLYPSLAQLPRFAVRDTTLGKKKCARLYTQQRCYIQTFP